MDIYEIIEKRKSIRNYSSKKIEEEKLERILNAGRKAPSAKNIQPWKFVVTRKNEIKEDLIKACKGQKFIGEADVIIAVCVDESEAYQHQGDYMTSFAVDGTIALEHMILAATREGLGTCWIGAFNESEVKKVLNIPDPFRVIGLTPGGYPEGDGANRNRKSLSDIVKWETFE